MTPPSRIMKSEKALPDRPQHNIRIVRVSNLKKRTDVGTAAAAAAILTEQLGPPQRLHEKFGVARHFVLQNQ